MKNVLAGILLILFSSSFMTVPEVRVTYFLSTTCKICQYYSLTLREIEKEFGQKNIQFRALFPGQLESEKSLTDFKSLYEIPFSCELDSTQHFLLNATVTPEVYVELNGQIIYHGRIDDSYAAIGQRRYKTKNHELLDVLNNLLTNKPITTTFVQPVGCIIEK